MSALWEAIVDIWEQSGFVKLLNFENGGWKNLIMIAVACLLMYPSLLVC